jgi:acetyltransferase
LTEPEAKSLLSAYRIPVAETHIASSPIAAGAAAARIGVPVALKILSPDITHKSDVGGVALDLATPGSVEAAAVAMLARIASSAPKAKLDGFTVSRMIRRPHAYELIAGVSLDAQFGPMILFGHGGVAAEVINDKALALPPLNLRLARDLIGRTRIARMLEGFRNRPPIDFDALALVLVRLSRLIEDLGEVAELDINPLLADETGVIALDARVRLAPAPGPSARRFAIRPYPAELEEIIPLDDGRKLVLRPVRPEDEPAFIEAFSKLDPTDVRLRFFAPLKTLSHELAARLTQIDYDREMALVLAESGQAGRTPILGVARIHADPDIENAEFAVVVRSDVQGRGFGYLLMSRLIAYARGRGLRTLFGGVLRDNRTMLALCRDLGFTITPTEDEPTVLRASLELDRPRQASPASSA